MIFQLKSLLKFTRNATNEHGVHSPYIFDLVTKCFYDKKRYIEYDTISKFRHQLRVNQKHIKVTDFGAGSKKLKSQQRRISDITKKAGISVKRAKLLHRLVQYSNSRNILEIGTSLGIATCSMAIVSKDVQIKTLEGCPQTANVAQNQFNKFKLENIKVQIGEFSKTLPETLKGQIFDLIYFDGNHQKDPTIAYFEQCLNHIHNGSVFIFDDIYWSKGMTEAWKYIKEDPRVTVSIDTFKWGIVFFRKEQPKQHFTIRI